MRISTTPVAASTAIRCIAMLAATGMMAASPALAQKKYGPGASDTEIRIGNTVPYSGPASAYGILGKSYAAYFKLINDQGGINGRKINFISYDDGYSPPKTVEQTRKLVESDEVMAIVGNVGTAANAAIQKYLNAKKTPQLFLATGATRWNDPKQFPWTMGWLPSYHAEALAYAKYLLKEKPDARIGVFYQNDDFGKDYVKGLREGLGDKASSMIVMETSYEVSEPTVDSHIVKLKAAGVDTVFSFATGKFAAQSIKKIAELGWKPLHIVPNASSSLGSVLRPAGLENAQDVVSATFAKDPTDPQWKDDPGMQKFYAYVEKYIPEGKAMESTVLSGYSIAQTMVAALQQCGDDLTRENLMKQAANLKGLQLDGLLPGVTVNTSPTDFSPIDQFQMMSFKGERWQRFGEIIKGEPPVVAGR
ncbi:branched-chain amino acid ABC transporter substrate-binding protein [Rhodopseudomonas boonkerdii]|uniref:ABC transporter substrate-binding protein n=1 Tax=Rhodopseudomonas boonkerdii TaxID=475937 RepID=UPI001E360D70|nr:ABC transporter substrate-binding protein [Rhodopseudomonas boonkerdii]UGV25814.1 branched-chain amino acid ABC transporter substrate-binding protein [Rhodopseudomonas boonkerdii]